MRGRRPKPTELKRLEGNPGKRPLNDDEPRPPATPPPIPKHLTEEARREWRRIVRELRPLGILSRLDRAILAAYVQSWARWIEAEENLRKVGTLIKSPSGYPIQNPYLAIANQAMSQMHRFLVELGLTPSARSRVRVPTENKKDDLDSFLDQGDDSDDA